MLVCCDKKVCTYVCIAIVFFICLEAGLRIRDGAPHPKRILLFQQGKNFVNYGSVFKYAPNAEIFNAAYYIKDDGATREYDSTIITNNLGLVQQRDIDDIHNVELVLGDSFAEGQGATPWFYKFDDEARQAGRNFVNGAILGTTTKQWEELKDKLKQDYGLEYKSVNVVILGGSANGRVWNFDDETLTCLHTGICKQKGDFYGYDFASKSEQQIQFDVIKLYSQPPRYVTYEKVKNVFYRIFLKSKDIENGNEVLEEGREALERLLNSGKEKGFILLVATKWDVRDGWSEGAKWIIEFAQKGEYRFSVCELMYEDFNINDGHPTAEGYNKILECTREISGVSKTVK